MNAPEPGTQTSPYALQDGETVYFGKLQSVQDIEEPHTKTRLRFPRVCNGLANNVEITVLELNVEYPTSRFQPVFEEGVELVENSGSAMQTRRIIGSPVAQREFVTREFGQQAAYAGREAVTKLAQPKPSAWTWEKRWWLVVGVCVFAVFIVGLRFVWSKS